MWIRTTNPSGFLNTADVLRAVIRRQDGVFDLYPMVARECRAVPYNAAAANEGSGSVIDEIEKSWCELEPDHYLNLSRFAFVELCDRQNLVALHLSDFPKRDNEFVYTGKQADKIRSHLFGRIG